MTIKPDEILATLFMAIKLLMAVCVVGVLLQQFGVKIPFVPSVNPLHLAYLAGALYAISH